MVSISRHHAKGKYKGNMMISTFFFEITYDDLYLSSVENRPGHGSPNPIQSTRKRPDPTRPDHTTGRAQAKFFTQNPNKPGPAWKITIKIWTWRNLTRPCHGSSSSQQFWPTNPTRPMTRSSWKRGTVHHQLLFGYQIPQDISALLFPKGGASHMNGISIE